MARQKKGSPVDGVLLLDKPIGRSSNQALQKCKWLFDAKKAGHTGSLDPLASGMLPICFGQAAKFSHFLLSSNKCYQVKLMLGVTTTTGDSEGEVIREQHVPSLTSFQIEQVLQTFRGIQKQIPPMYSALKHQGKPLYQLARQGKTIEREPRVITIFQLLLDEFLISARPLLTLTVSCSKGTYIRTLAEDIGNAIGCGAHVVYLRRLWVEPYLGESMSTIEDLEVLDPHARHSVLLSIDKAFSKLLPHIHLSEKETFSVFSGLKLEKDTNAPQGWVILKGPNAEFLGIGEKLPTGLLAPRRMMASTLPSQIVNCEE